MPKIKMTDDQIDSIVVGELKRAIKMNLDSYRSDCELIDALKRTFVYYSSPDEYDAFIRKIEKRHD